MKPPLHIWPGSVRAFVSLCFLMLTLLFVTDLGHFMHQTLNHTENTIYHQQEKIFLELKRRIAPPYLTSLRCDDQDDELKA
jgi:hypothetical protein